MSTDDRKLGRGIAWVGIASGLAGILDAVTTVACLWLWISTDDLGTATLAGAMLPVLERIAGVGMPAALVRFAGDEVVDRARTQSTLLWLNVAGALAVLAGVLALGPVIGTLFNAPIVASLLIGYAIKLVIQTGYVVPESQLRHELQFDKLTRIRIAASCSEAAAKLVTAYLGAHGYPELRIWCFVAGPLANGIVTLAGIQLQRPWRPRLAFDRAIAARGLRYGTQVSGGELLYFIYTNADYWVIGRAWGNAAVGAYRLAYELILDVVRLISLVTAEVAFPAFARIHRDPATQSQRAGDLLIRFTRQNAIALVPVLVFLAVSADDLLAVLYPPLPAAATAAARILCLVGALRVLSFVLPAMLAGLGHASDVLAYHLLASLTLPLAFVASAHLFPHLNYLAVAWAWTAAYPLVFALLLARALTRCHVPLGSYLRSLAGITASGAIAAIGALATHAALPLSPLPRLLAVAAVTLSLYLVAIARIEHMTPRSILANLK